MLTTVVAGRVFDYSHCIGMRGGAGRGFTTVVDFAIGSDGVLYLIERGDLAQRICKITVNHKYLADFGGSGSNDGQFLWPTSIDIDRDENLYVADEYLQRVSIFDKEGKFLSKWGKAGNSDGELNRPSGIALGPEDDLYVVDSLNHRVQKFTKEGDFLGKWGQQGSGEGEFNMPWGICVDKDGDVYVADWMNGRVQKFSPDGKFLTKFGGSVAGEELERPCGVAVDSEGDVYIIDWSAHRLLVYGLDGAFVTYLEGDAQDVSPWAQEYLAVNLDYLQVRRRVNPELDWRFRRPVAVKVDANDTIFVAEIGQHRIQVYNKVKDFVEADPVF